MTTQVESTFWEGKATDVAYKDPYSETTNRARKKVFLFSSLILLNHFFPLDLDQSHFLGIHFKEGLSPSLSGLLALLVLYFSTLLVVYTYQEIQAWLAQSNSLDFAGSRRSLHSIYSHHQSLANAIDSATTQLKLHNGATTELSVALKLNENIDKHAVERNLNELEVHKQSFENFYTSIEKSNHEFGEEIQKAKVAYQKATSNYKSAMLTQIFKVGILEIILPFALAAISIYLSQEGIHEIVKAVFG
jgi:hypothetical protein